MRDASSFDKEVAKNALDVVMGHPELWLADTLHNVLRELQIQLQDRHYRVLSTPLEDTSILRLALLASSDLEEEEFAPTYLTRRFLRQPRPAMLSLVLRGIMTLSEREEMARKMRVLLPDLRRVLSFGYKGVTMKALVVFRHLMAQLEREEASPIAVQLAEFVLPFFDDVRLLGKPEPHGPPALGQGQRTLCVLPGNSDYCDPELFKETAKITMELASPVLLARLNQAEEQLFLGKMAEFE
ncbi:hypothetical protein AV530_011929 [Patagioenas fasciata monilis]|uniref:Maestro/Maestro-like HEAT-repeats domain-containing protein n=1 Tax=Patagioenas fasciata monilis TaxID=372326 RepID=A0A1V4JUC3_PATFA|nr:hypothetical protein AV530_011929 [Patagioenas fasciata monilis]